MSRPRELSQGLKLRRAEREDARLLWEWANDPEVRAVSFHPQPIPWEEHIGWLERRLDDKDCLLFIACEEGGAPIGQVRFDMDEGKATVSISLDRRFRSRGRGAQILQTACREFFSLHLRPAIHAWIKEANEASLRAFHRTGFHDHAHEVVHGSPAWHLILEERNLPQ